MMQRLPKLPRHAWGRIIQRTLLLTIVAALSSLLISHVLLSTLSAGLDLVGSLAALTVPTVFGGPMIFWLSLRNAELHEACRLLEKAAASDSLTGCLNHGTFVSRVKTALMRPDLSGAMLVVDADHFKSINDRYGHEAGDLALQHIAACIQGAVSAGDLVGRVGGEEFAVFLPRASRSRAAAVAETIRSNIDTMTCVVDDMTCPLSVSIGGAVFQRPAPFQDIFRAADRQLYGVKNTGRNAVDLIAFDASIFPEPLARAS